MVYSITMSLVVLSIVSMYYCIKNYEKYIHSGFHCVFLPVICCLTTLISLIVFSGEIYIDCFMSWIRFDDIKTVSIEKYMEGEFPKVLVLADNGKRFIARYYNSNVPKIGEKWKIEKAWQEIYTSENVK